MAGSRASTPPWPAPAPAAALPSSTPTAGGGAGGAGRAPAWQAFAAQADSPLSEIENGDSPALAFDTEVCIEVGDFFH